MPEIGQQSPAASLGYAALFRLTGSLTRYRRRDARLAALAKATTLVAVAAGPAGAALVTVWRQHPLLYRYAFLILLVALPVCMLDKLLVSYFDQRAVMRRAPSARRWYALPAFSANEMPAACMLFLVVLATRHADPHLLWTSWWLFLAASWYLALLAFPAYGPGRDVVGPDAVLYAHGDPVYQAEVVQAWRADQVAGRPGRPTRWPDGRGRPDFHLVRLLANAAESALVGRRLMLSRRDTLDPADVEDVSTALRFPHGAQRYLDSAELLVVSVRELPAAQVDGPVRAGLRWSEGHIRLTECEMLLQRGPPPACGAGTHRAGTAGRRRSCRLLLPVSNLAIRLPMPTAWWVRH